MVVVVVGGGGAVIGTVVTGGGSVVVSGGGGLAGSIMGVAVVGGVGLTMGIVSSWVEAAIEGEEISGIFSYSSFLL